MRVVQYSADSSQTDDGEADDDGAADPSNDADSDGTVLATTVDLADSLLRQTRGLMFERSLPDSYALAFRFDDVTTQDIHMLFVFVPLDVVWVADGVVQRVERLRPWRGFARDEADLILEFPAGAADSVEPGDRIVLEDE